MARYLYLVLLGLLAVQVPVWSQSRLVDSGQNLPGVWAGKAAWGDYDNDGSLDLAIIGETVDSKDQCLRIARIFGNDEGILTEFPEAGVQLVGVYYGDLAWGDYDSDGDLDLAVAGWDVEGEESLQLYENEARVNGTDTTFVLKLALDQTALQGVRYADLAWGDYDSDGDLDLAVTGMEAKGTSLTQIYRNPGKEGQWALQLDELNSEVLVYLHKGDLAWGDYDNDGDLDLVVTGENVTPTGGLRSVTEFYQNDPTGVLSLDGTLSASVKVKGGAVAWADYDGDGNLDLAVTGRDDSWNPSLRLYRNRPTGVLTQENFNFSVTQQIVDDAAWVDYDNDGDPDLAVTGRSILSSYHAFIFTYDEEAGGIVRVSSEDGLEGLAGGAAAWVDYDGNGTVDLLLCGVDAAGQRRTILYSNGTPVSNRAPDSPRDLNPPKITSDRVLFSWLPGTDPDLGTQNLSYNLRVGTGPGDNDILSGEIPPGPGNAGFKTNRTLELSLPRGTFYWSVQTVDGGFARSEWSQEEIFNVLQFVSSDQRLRALKEAAIAWGDYDSDGDYDLVIMGQNRSSQAQTLFYENINGVLTAQNEAGLLLLRNGDVAWGDADGDGDLDLLLTGQDTFRNRRTVFYSTGQNSTGFSFTPGTSSPDSLSNSSAAWGDYDGDGDLDLVLMGQSDDILDRVQQSYTRVYVNDGQGGFASGTQEIIGLNNGEVEWGDYDGDGDLDLAATGISTEASRELRVYRNDAGQLIDAELGLAGLESSDLAWGDYDGDGDLDLAAGGIGDAGPVTSIYENKGSGQLTALSDVDLPGIQVGDLAWGDYDNDRDLDLVVAGNDGQTSLLQVFENTIGRTDISAPFEIENVDPEVVRPVDFSAVTLVDYDDDGDLDLISAGSTGGTNPLPLTTVNDNLEAQFNANLSPEIPFIDAAEDSADTVVLSWQQATDDGETSPLSLTYNVRVGTVSEANDVLSGNIPLGPGNAGHRLTHRLQGLPSGTYYWSVQTVDDGLARSAWSTPQRFTIDTVPPRIDTLNLSRQQLGIGQTVTLALSLLDEHSGVDATVEPQVTATIGGESYAFEVLQFTGESWSGALTVTPEMPSGGASVNVRGVVDGKSNPMAPFTRTNSFTVDTELPVVETTSPVAAAEDVPISTSEIAIIFTEPIKEETATAENFQIKLEGQVLPMRIEPPDDQNPRTVRLIPENGLIPGSEYIVEVSAAVQDLAGNRPENAISWTFSTRVPQLTQTRPEDSAAGVGLEEGRISAVFDAAVIDSLLRIEETVQVLREGEVQSLRDIPRFDTESNVLSFELAAGLKPGSRYEVTLSGLLAGPLRAVAEGDFTWQFQTAVPQLVGRSPEGAVAEVEELIEAEFSSVIDVSLLGVETVQVLREGTAESLREGSVRFDAESNVLSFELAAGLKPGSRYEVTLSGLLAGPLRAVAEGDFTWQFQTPVPEIATTVPAHGDTAVSSLESTLTISFDHPIDADALILDNVAVLKEGTEVPVANLEYIGETRSARFLVEEGLRAGTGYQVRIAAAVGGPLHQSDYTWRFSTAVPLLVGAAPESGTSGVEITLNEATVRFSVPLDTNQVKADNFVLRREGVVVVLRAGDPVDRDGGVYGLAPAAGWQVGSRYTVQIAPSVSGPLGPGQTIVLPFQTAVPDVVTVEPAAGDTAVSPLTSTIEVTFDKPIDDAALREAGNVRLLQEGRAVDIGEPAYNPDDKIVTFAPQNGLRGGTGYQVRIAAAVGGPLRQEQGDFRWSFSTRVPIVVSTDPPADAAIRSGIRRVQVTFSSPIDEDLITPQNFRLSRSGVPFSLEQSEFLYDAETWTVSFPSVEFFSGSAYQAAVSARLSGPLGAYLPDRQWSFRTQVPEIIGTRPADGEDGVSLSVPSIEIVFSEPVARQLPADFQLLARDLGDPEAAPELVMITSPSTRDSGDAMILSFVPEEGLRSFTEYQVSIAREVLGELAEAGFTWTFRTAAYVTDPAQGGTVANASRSVELYFPPNALEAGAGEIVIRRLVDAAGKLLVQDDGLTRISSAYEIRADGASLRKPVTLTMRYTDAELGGRNPVNLGIFRQENGQWQRIGGIVETEERAARTAVDQLGIFAIFEDLSTPVGKLAIQNLDCQPRAFAPTSADKAETDISFTLTGPANVTVRIYNASGRLERVITREDPMAPGRISLKWDGQDEDRKTVASGLYIVVVNAGDARQEKVVAVVR